jgi:tetratricopeptide (TPR) repeat protein
LLRTIQSFALERLVASGRAAEVHRLHAEAFHALAAEGASHLGTSRHAASLERVEPEIANLRAAIGWAIDADQGDLALRLTGVSWRFWHSFGLLNEGRRLTAEALASPAAQAVSSARAWASAAAGNLAYWQGDHAAAREYYEAQRSLALDAGDDACLADASFNLIHFGVVDLAHVGVVDLDDTDAQIAYIDSLVDRFRAIGDERGAARADWFRGTLLAATGRVDEAISRMLEELESFERLDDAQYHAMTAAGLGWTKFVRGDHEDAVHWSVRALVEAHAMRDVATATITLSIGVLIGVMRGRYEDGAIINGAFDSLCDRYGVRPPVPLSEIIGVVDPISATREALDPETFAAAYARGRSLSLDEAVALVVELADQERSLE